MKLLVKPQNGNHSKPQKISSMYKQWVMIMHSIYGTVSTLTWPLLNTHPEVLSKQKIIALHYTC